MKLIMRLKAAQGNATNPQFGGGFLLILLVVSVLGISITTGHVRVHENRRSVETLIARERATLTLERRILFAQHLLERGDTPPGAAVDGNFVHVTAQALETDTLGRTLGFTVQATLTRMAPHSLVSWEVLPPLSVGRRSLGPGTTRPTRAALPWSPGTSQTFTAQPMVQELLPPPPWLSRVVTMTLLGGMASLLALVGMLFGLDRSIGKGYPFQ